MLSYKLNAKLQDIERTFGAQFIDPASYTPMEEINAFDFLETPVITDENLGEIQMFNWGLISYWAKGDKIKKITLNAKIESATEKPAFRNSVKNRCLIIANGYYEWQWLDPKDKQKQKYFIKPKAQDIFAFAGIYSSWKIRLRWSRNKFDQSQTLMRQEWNTSHQGQFRFSIPRLRTTQSKSIIN